MQFISVEDLKKRFEESAPIFLVDIRENYEREAYSIPSYHIPMAEVCDRLNEFPSDQQVVVMCNSGKRAEALVNLLETDFGKKELTVLEGGISAWMDQIGIN